MKQLPSGFQLGGRTWVVEYTDEVDHNGSLGQCDSCQAKIHIRNNLSPELTAHTFYHELAHALCFTLGWEKLNKDEAKIDAIGGLLLQFAETKKGKLE